MFYMIPIHHIAHLQPLFQFLATPECNYYILRAQLVPYFSIDNAHLMYNAHPKLMYTAHVHFLQI